MSIFSKISNVFFKKIYAPIFPPNPIKSEHYHESLYSFILEIYNKVIDGHEICVDDYYSGMTMDIVATYIHKRTIYYNYLDFNLFKKDIDELQASNLELHNKIRDFFNEKIDFPAPVSEKDMKIFTQNDLNYIKAVIIFS